MRRRNFLVIFLIFMFSNCLFLAFISNNQINQRSRDFSDTIGILSHAYGVVDVVSSDNDGFSSSPEIAVDTFGNIHVVWFDDFDFNGTGSDYDIFYKFWNASTGVWRGGVNETDVLTNGSSGASMFPKLAVDGTGNVHVVWRENTGVWQVFYKFFDQSTKTWSGQVNETDLVSYLGTNSGSPAIVVDGSDNLHVVWSDSTDLYDSGSDNDVFYRCWNATTNVWNGTVNATDVVSTESNSSSIFPDITKDETGNVHVVWEDDSYIYDAGMGESDIFYRFLNATSGLWSGRTNGTDVVSEESTADAERVRTHADIWGNVHVVWQDETGSPGEPNIHYRFFNLTSGIWSGQVSQTDIISSESPRRSEFPDVMADEDGNVHVVWQDNSSIYAAGIDWDIFYKVWNGAMWHGINTPTDVFTDTSDDAQKPTITVDEEGSLHVVWIDETDYLGANTDADIFYRKLINELDVPNLLPISPNPDDNGVILLDWDDINRATTYFVYRNTSVITSIIGLIPIDEISQSDYRDIVYTNATYYYVVVAGNNEINSSISNCESVTVGIPSLGVGWTTAELVSAESTWDTENPRVAVDKTGNIHVVWQDHTDVAGNGNDKDILYKRWNASTGIWMPIEVLSNTGSDSHEPTIAADIAGNVHVAWYEWSANDDIFYTRWEPGTETWTIPVVVSTESVSSSHYPWITADHMGYVHLAWKDPSDINDAGIDWDIHYKRWNPTTKIWRGLVNDTDIVSKESMGDSFYQELAVDGLGNVHVVWQDEWDYGGPDGDTDVYYNHWDASAGAWMAIELVSSGSAGGSYWPTIGAGRDGTVHVAWQDDSLGPVDIFYRRWDITTKAWTVRDILTSGIGGVEPSLAVDSWGNAHLAFQSGFIYYNVWNASTESWDSNTLITPESSWGASFPMLVVDSQNNLHVVWNEGTPMAGSGGDIDVFYKKKYTGLGVPGTGPRPPPNLLPFIILGILIATIGAVAAAGGTFGYRFYRRRASSTKALKEVKLTPTKTKFITDKYQELESVFKDGMPVDEKLKFLVENKIPLDFVPELHDDVLTKFFNQIFASVPVALLDKLAKLDVPVEEKLAIVEEFTNLPRDLQKEFLKDLDEL